jgi:peptide-methionine (R)-S-oxide reductase
MLVAMMEFLEDPTLNARPPCTKAETSNQLRSIAELPRQRKYALYEDIREDNLEQYFNISCKPITKRAEDDMELVSDIITWGERYLHHWERGVYRCSRCSQILFRSIDKYKGPCIWPSFRQPIEADAVIFCRVYPYNRYTVAVDEVYCSQCDLFIGHRFEDAKLKGDTHPLAHWRH